MKNIGVMVDIENKKTNKNTSSDSRQKNNNLQPSSMESAPQANNNEGYNFGFEDDNNDNEGFNVDENNQIELNIHKSKAMENNRKKMFINKSSFQNPLKEEDYDMENPYK